VAGAYTVTGAAARAALENGAANAMPVIPMTAP
jgi:hypothetical protein